MKYTWFFAHTALYCPGYWQEETTSLSHSMNYFPINPIYFAFRSGKKWRNGTAELTKMSVKDVDAMQNDTRWSNDDESDMEKCISPRRSEEKEKEVEKDRTSLFSRWGKLKLDWLSQKRSSYASRGRKFKIKFSHGFYSLPFQAFCRKAKLTGVIKTEYGRPQLLARSIYVILIHFTWT